LSATVLLTDLKIVARLGVGLDNIAVDAATARGVWVTNVPDYCVEEVSDHAVAMALASHIAFSSDVSIAEPRRRASEEVVRVLAGQRPLQPCNEISL
jgi:hypothetical protein